MALRKKSENRPIYVRATCGKWRIGKEGDAESFDTMDGVIVGVATERNDFEGTISTRILLQMVDRATPDKVYIANGSIITAQVTTFGRMLITRLYAMGEAGVGREIEISVYACGEKKSTCVALRLKGERETIKGVPINKEDPLQCRKDILRMVEELAEWYGPVNQHLSAEEHWEAVREPGAYRDVDYAAYDDADSGPDGAVEAPWEEPRPRPNPIGVDQAAAQPAVRTVPGRTEPTAAATAPAVVETTAEPDEEKPSHDEIKALWETMEAGAKRAWGATWEDRLSTMLGEISQGMNDIPRMAKPSEMKEAIGRINLIRYDAPAPAVVSPASTSTTPHAQASASVDPSQPAELPHHIQLIRSTQVSRSWSDAELLFLLDSMDIPSVDAVPAESAEIVRAALRDFNRRREIRETMAMIAAERGQESPF